MATEHDWLLAGPRGRRLCLEFARRYGAQDGEANELHQALFYAAYDLDPDRGGSRAMFGHGAKASPVVLPAHVASLLSSLTMDEVTPEAVRIALVACVDNARYWQEPDGEDVLASMPELREGLSQVAAALADSAHIDWWRTAIDTDSQWVVNLKDDPGNTETPEPATSEPATVLLEKWRAKQAAEDIAAQHTQWWRRRRQWAGPWWSIPPRGLTQTTRGWGDNGPAGLWLIEDGFGQDAASAHRIDRVNGTGVNSARIYEIDTPEAWSNLCTRYTLDVTAARKILWHQVTGRDGGWAIPNWPRVADDYDAIHLTVAGYLSTAGRAIPVDGDIMSVLAGWDPDQTYWLTDVGLDASSSQHWRRTQDSGWALG